MRWSIFVDLDRPLAAQEQGDLFAALEELVPGSGCIGPDRGDVWEVYFAVEAPSADAARLVAGQSMERMIAASGVAVGYAITVQAGPR